MNRPGIGENCVCFLFIVVTFMGIGGAKKYGAFKVIIWREAEGGGGKFFMGELTPHVFYQNYLPISVSFSIKRVLCYARHNIPSC